ncbi:MAG: LysR family transcriptional regulator [Alphaproteobacteria bacterium]|nr:LysR family transcriptional regulator [Alphaproteobacteria bacterium]
MPVNHRQIEAFMAVMLTGSMTAAAELLHVTQPAISRLIRDLEIVAGFELFRRAGPRIQPTAEAVQLQAETERHMSGLLRIERALEDIRAMTLGTLRIGAMTAPGISFLPRLVAEFVTKHPGVTVRLHTDDSRAVLEQVTHRHLELGFGAFRADAPGAVVQELPDLEAVIALHADHPLARHSVIDIAALEDEDFLSLGRNGLLRHRVDRALSDANIKPRHKIETPLSATICTLVAANVGVGIIDPFTALEVTDPQIAVRQFRPRIPYEIALAFSPGAPPSRLASDFAEIIKTATANVSVLSD